MLLGLTVVFFASGASALLFETLWFRQAGLMFGNSVWATSLVTASFMGGLALGNAAAAFRGDRLRRPIRAYAALELGIGVSGMGLVLLFPVLTPALAPLFRAVLEVPQLLNAVRLALAFGLLLIPATAMGATLPLLVRTLTKGEADFGRALGWLYGWNTLGAVIGSLAGELALVRALGLRGTAAAAACLNLLAALTALRLERRAPAAAEPTQAGGPSPRNAWLLLAAAFVSGGILLALEVVWFRFMLLFVIASSLSFATMLCVVLLGVGAGGLGASQWLRWRPGAERFLPLIALLASLATLLGYAAFPQFLSNVHGFLFDPWSIGQAALRLMLPTALASGLVFTFLGQALRGAVAGETRTAGALTLANTTGAMLGALAGGFLLLPHLGVERSLFWLGAGYAVVCLAALLGRGHRPSRGEAAALVAAALAVGLTLAFYPSGLMRNYYLPVSASRWGGRGVAIAAVREGLTETVIYLRRDLLGQTESYRLLTNGTSLSSTSFSNARYMRLFGYWPLAMHPAPRRALLISYGLGLTAQALTESDDLQAIDVVDISRDILELGRIAVEAPNAFPLDDRRVQVHVEDGRFFLLTTNRRYDIITAEPPPPKDAGIVNLYSAEYFDLLRDRLAEGGIATYWLPVWLLEERDAQSIARAFCGAFPDCSLWEGFGPEWMLVGTRNALGPGSPDRMSRLWRQPRSLPALLEIGLDRPASLGTLFVADASRIAEWTRDVAPLDDDHPQRLSHRPPGPADSFYAWARGGGQGFTDSPLIRRLWPDAIRQSTIDAFAEAEPIRDYCWTVYGVGRPELERLQALQSRSSAHGPALWLQGFSLKQEQIARRARARGVADPMLDAILGAAAVADRDFARGAELLGQAIQGSAPGADWLRQLQAYALATAGDRAGASRLLAAAGRTGADASNWSWLERTFGLSREAARSAPAR